MIGTVSVITDKPMRMDDVLPDWLERGVESSLRDSEDDAPPLDVPMALSSGGKHVMKGVLTPPVVLTPSGGSSPRTGGAWRDLDSFYADAEEESEDEEEEDGDDEEDDEEEEEEEEESEAEEEESQSEGERNS
jgi:AP-3 complex subunit beta